MPGLPTLVVLSAAVGVWYYLTRTREIATSHCRQYCQQMDLQLIDDTVHRLSTRLQRNKQGTLIPVSDYQFQFSIEGQERYTAHLLMHGFTLQLIEMDHPDGKIIWRKQDS